MRATTHSCRRRQYRQKSSYQEQEIIAMGGSDRQTTARARARVKQLFALSWSRATRKYYDSFVTIVVLGK